ncbi:MAG TPA: dienelactone hydrolase family protein [bacterium]|nr:dienelactone hydrolase family protein [bacterium]
MTGGQNGAEARLGRREFLRRLSLAGAGTGAGLALFPGLVGAPGVIRALAAPATGPVLPGSPPDKQDPRGITVRPDDPAISASPVEYSGRITPLLGYLSLPASPEVYPGILVLHDVPGMTEHVRDATRRLAKAGYVALAVDLLSRMGGAAKVGDAAAISTALSTITAPQYLQDMNSSVSYLEARPLAAKSRIGVLGFGLGGSLAWLLLSQNPDLKAGVIFSGGVPSATMVPRITAAVLAIFGEAEERDTKEISDFDAAMKKTGRAWAYKVESKAGRGFFDDTRDRYVPDAAKDAWRLTLDWYATHLSAS